ncbi:hypothetical protein LXA43DRAFT_358142 [Ganoderma leucocontextum]|nr:hypothetical protein LXA43DRAFT_358142 [Ganoderma leucocontextum]
MEAFDDDTPGFITIAEMNYFPMLRQKERRRTAGLLYYVRLVRRNAVYGTRRVVSMERGSRLTGTFDSYDKPACVGCTPTMSRDNISSPHLPTHDFVKIRAPILRYREIGEVLRDATAGLKQAKRLHQRRRCEFAKIHEQAQTRDGEKGSEDGEDNEDEQDGRDGWVSQDDADGEDSEGSVSSLEKDITPETRGDKRRQGDIATSDSYGGAVRRALAPSGGLRSQIENRETLALDGSLLGPSFVATQPCLITRRSYKTRKIGVP